MIADPMADLGASATATQTQQSTSSKDVVDPLVLNSNLQRIDHIHAVMGVASGCIAGTLGLTGLQGFVCFVLLHSLVTLSIWVFKMKCQLSKYTKQTAFGFYTASIQPTALSFTLFWTLFYGLVFLY